jgi:GST-like protein
MAKPIDLYYWTTPNGWKIAIMLEECGLPYRVHMVDIGNNEQFDPEFLKISPNNKIPAIVDHDGPDGKPISVFESGAILQYLARKTESFYGVTESDRVKVDQWLMWQMGGLGPMAGQAHHFLHYAPEDVPYAKKRYVNEVKRLYGVLDNQLSTKPFVCGNFYSIADIAIWSWAVILERQEQDAEDFPNVKAWLARVGKRGAVQKGRNLDGSSPRVVQKEKA